MYHETHIFSEHCKDTISSIFRKVNQYIQFRQYNGIGKFVLVPYEVNAVESYTLSNMSIVF